MAQFQTGDFGALGRISWMLSQNDPINDPIIFLQLVKEVILDVAPQNQSRQDIEGLINAQLKRLSTIRKSSDPRYKQCIMMLKEQYQAYLNSLYYAMQKHFNDTEAFRTFVISYIDMKIIPCDEIYLEQVAMGGMSSLQDNINLADSIDSLDLISVEFSNLHLKDQVTLEAFVSNYEAQQVCFNDLQLAYAKLQKQLLDACFDLMDKCFREKLLEYTTLALQFIAGSTQKCVAEQYRARRGSFPQQQVNPEDVRFLREALSSLIKGENLTLSQKFMKLFVDRGVTVPNNYEKLLNRVACSLQSLKLESDEKFEKRKIQLIEDANSEINRINGIKDREVLRRERDTVAEQFEQLQAFSYEQVLKIFTQGFAKSVILISESATDQQIADKLSEAVKLLNKNLQKHCELHKVQRILEKYQELKLDPVEELNENHPARTAYKIIRKYFNCHYAQKTPKELVDFLKQAAAKETIFKDGTHSLYKLTNSKAAKSALTELQKALVELGGLAEANFFSLLGNCGYYIPYIAGTTKLDAIIQVTQQLQSFNLFLTLTKKNKEQFNSLSNFCDILIKVLPLGYV